jgi:hypothetical protein
MYIKNILLIIFLLCSVAHADRKAELTAWKKQADGWINSSRELNNNLKELHDSALSDEEIQEITEDAVVETEDLMRGIIEKSQIILISYENNKDSNDQILEDKYQSLFTKLTVAYNTGQDNIELCLRDADESFLKKRQNFSSEGVDKAIREAKFLMHEWALHRKRISSLVQQSIENLVTSIIELLVAIFKIILACLAIRWVKRRMDSKGRGKNSIIIWYILRVFKSLYFWLFIYMIMMPLRIVFEIPELALIESALYAGTWAYLAYQLADAMAVRRLMLYPRGDTFQEKRRKSLKRLAIYGAFIIVIFNFPKTYLLGLLALQFIAYSFCIICLLLILFSLVVIWRGIILAEVDKLPETNPLKKWVKPYCQGNFEYLAVAVAAPYIVVRAIGDWFFIASVDVEFLRPVMTSLFRAEIARQSEQDLDGLIPVNPELLLDNNDEYLIEDYAQTELEFIVNSPNKSGMTLICGEQGMGKTMFLQRTYKQAPEDSKAALLKCKSEGVQVLVEDIAFKLELEATTIEELAEAMSEGRYFICLDDVHALLSTRVGGLDEMDKLCKLVRLTSRSARWVLGLNQATWRFLLRAREKHVLFDSIIKLPNWNDSQIERLVRLRLEKKQIHPDFSGLVIPAQFDKPDENGQYNRDKIYFRMLRDYCEGNPRVALHFWHRSLFIDDEEGNIFQVRLFRPPLLDKLDNMPSLAYFNLRTILQMCEVSREDLMICSGQAQYVVDDSLRVLIANGYIREHNGKFRINRHWFRAIVIILRRKHLMAE